MKTDNVPTTAWRKKKKKKKNDEKTARFLVA